MEKLINSILQFLTDPNTDFGFLINGPWGSGKTHFWKNIAVPRIDEVLSQTNAEETVSIYVSLNGISDVTHLDNEIFWQLRSGTVETIGRSAAFLGRIASRIAGKELLTEKELAPIRDAIMKKKKMIVCFDDVERCKLPIEETLAYVNRFVEHIGAKVVLMCDESQIDDNENYNKRKEKVIRITHEFTIDHLPIIDSIVEKWEGSSGFKQFLKDSLGHIQDIYQASKLKNLRLLKFAITILDRALGALEEIESKPTTFTRSLSWTLIPVAIDLQAGRLNKSQAREIIEGGPSVVYAELFATNDDKSDKDPQILEFVRRYGLIEHIGDMTASPSLASLVTTGTIDLAAFAEEAGRALTAEEEANSPVNQLIKNGFDLEDAEFAGIFAHALEQIKSGMISDWNTLTETMRFMSHCVNHRIFDTDSDSLRSSFQVGINAQVESEQFQAVSSWNSAHDIHIFEDDSGDVKWLRDALIEANQNVESMKRDETFAKLWQDVDGTETATEFVQFFKNDGINGIDATPLSQLIDAAPFVDKLFSIQNGTLRTISSLLRERYLRAGKRNALTDDFPWFESVNSLLATKLEQKQPAPSKIQLQWLRNTINEIIDVYKPTEPNK